MRIKFFILIFLIFSTYVHANDTQDLDIQIFKNLRCIVCQGQSIAESNSEFAQTLKIVVRDRLSKGDSEQEIIQLPSGEAGGDVSSSGSRGVMMKISALLSGFFWKTVIQYYSLCNIIQHVLIFTSVH